MMTVVDLRSDTFTLPTPEMIAALPEAPLGDDMYGEDPTAAALERRAAALTGKPAALFLLSGTQANLVALMSLAERGDEVLMGAGSDLFNFEAGGAAVVAGMHPRPLPDDDGLIEPADVAAAVRPDDVHFGRTRILAIENTHARSGGRAIPIPHLAALRAAADERGLLIHMDGARLFNAAVACGEPAATLCAHADTVSFCLSKGLSAPAGALLCGSKETIGRARRVRKLLGGALRQAGWLASPGLVALNDIARLAEDHRRARALAVGLARLPGLRVDPAAVQSNIVLVGLAPEIDPGRYQAALRAVGVHCFTVGSRLRMVVHRHIDDAAIERVLVGAAHALSHALADSAETSSPY